MLPRRAAAPAVAVLLTCLLAGCSGGAAPADGSGADGPAANGSAASGTAGTAGPEGPADDPDARAREAVRATFTGYGEALLRRDFATACAALTDEARKALIADLNARGIPATTCEQGYTAIYVTDAAKALDEQGRSVRVVDVTVDGATGTLTYTGTVRGRPVPPQTIRVQRVGDGWQIAPAR